MSRKFGKQFAPTRRVRTRKPVRCGRCHTTVAVRASRYPAAGHGDVCQTCHDKLARRLAEVPTSANAAEAKAAATRDQVARLVELAAEREAELVS